MAKHVPEEERFTYGVYLRVPELLSLQSPQAPEVHGEMLFIVAQQAQELWFKQILYELRRVLDLLRGRELLEASRMLDRVNRILKTLGDQAEILEMLPLVEFHAFRGYLKAASGLESEQFRELELASGLNDPAYLRMASRLIDMDVYRARWPETLHDALLDVLHDLYPDPIEALCRVYSSPDDYPDLYLLTEAFSEYEVRFSEWRFHHIKVVERVIGDRSAGTGGSSGSTYLGHTLNYRFFPELWEARNQLTARTNTPASPIPS